LESSALMRIRKPLRQAEQTSSSADIKDRRRPGRDDQISPHLLPLLRNPAILDLPAALPDTLETPASGDDLAHLKGIPLSLVVSLVLGVPFWAWIAGIVRAVLR